MVELMLVAVLLLQVAILVAFLARRGSGRTTAQAAESQPAGTSLEPASTEVPDEVGHEDHDRERTVAALLAGEELAIGLDQTDPLLNLRFATEFPAASAPAADPNLSRLLGSFGHVLPLIPRGLPEGVLVARFTPEVASMVSSGQARLMVSQGQELMKAVSTTTGWTVGTARRVSEVGVGVGALALGPLGMVTAVAVVAASWHHQRWVDRTLGRIARSTAAIETRLRDDDFGTLHAGADAAERYLNVVEFTRPTPPVVLHELAAAALAANQLYRARIRRVHAFLAALDQLQDDHEQRTGASAAWSKGVDQLLGEGDRFYNDVVVAVQAAMVRAKLQALTSIELALEGEPAAAQHQLIETLDACNNEVHALRRRTRALAGSQPRLAVARSKARNAADAVSRVEHFFDAGVLDALPERVSPNEPLEISIPVQPRQLAR